jgi:hypothetical protein
VAVTRDSCVIWYDEISKRRNTAGQTCTVDTCRPRRHVPLSPRSSCNRGSPRVITGQAVLNQWVASRTRHLSTFCSRAFAVHHPTPFHLHAPLRAKSPYCEFPRSIRYNLGLVRYYQNNCNLENRKPKNMPKTNEYMFVAIYLSVIQGHTQSLITCRVL